MSAENPAPPTKERSLSAREAKELTKEIQESSAEIKKVFPRTGGAWRSYSWGRTSYNSDFGPKPEVKRTKARPSSRTRLNNPHPNQVLKEMHCRTTVLPLNAALFCRAF